MLEVAVFVWLSLFSARLFLFIIKVLINMPTYLYILSDSIVLDTFIWPEIFQAYFLLFQQQ
jgi:hypothetical protein